MEFCISDSEFNPVAFKKLKEAHEALESRFSRCMTQVAELSDDKQNLEHVIQQLQVENDSIGKKTSFFFLSFFFPISGKNAKSI